MNKNIREVWKAIEGYEDKYEVSNLGEVRSISRPMVTVHGGEYMYKGRVLKNSPDVYGYRRVTLSDLDCKQKVHKVHILVASTFIENTDSNAIHATFIDGDKSNLRVDNLEWVSSSVTGRKGSAVAGRGRPKQTKEENVK